MIEIKIRKTHPNAVTPTGKEGNAAYDLYAVDNSTLFAMSRSVIPTGVSFELPNGTYARIAGRSGLAAKGIDVLGGVVDPSYRGEIRAILLNTSCEDVVILAGDRIAQVVFERYETAEFVEVQALTETERNANGFGSSGR